jgi:hypothetical protein
VTQAEKRALAALFDDLDHHQGAAGCNDFRLAEVMPDVNERRALMRAVEVFNNTPDDFDPSAAYEVVPDFCVLSYFRHKLGLDDA